LRVVARHEPAMFRSLVDFCRTHYDADKATYHVSATLAVVPPSPRITSDSELERVYLERWPDVPQGLGFRAQGRQILHCTFGSVLTDERWGPAIRDVLALHADTYTEMLREHFTRHLQALRAGM
jgi:tagaturonate epimerase